MVTTKKNITKTHGEYLDDLQKWSGFKKAGFALKIGVTRPTLDELLKQERIQAEYIFQICRAVGVPPKYFDGGYELPLDLPIVKEGSEKYLTRIEHLELENRQLSKDKVELQAKYITALETIKTLQEDALRLR